MDLRFLWLSIILLKDLILCREYDECRGINEPDVLVTSGESCAKYIFCDGENSYEGECLAGNYFNAVTGVCDDPKNVKCNIQPYDENKSIYDEDLTSEEIDQHSTVDDKDVNDIEYVKSMEVEEIQELEESEVTENNEIYTTQVPTPKCTQLKGFNNIKHIANPESCVTYYTCYNGHAISMLCPAKMFFNEEAGKCQSEMPESCKASYSVRLNCYKGVYDFVPHPSRCAYYFYCVNGYLLIMRCPFDFTWHYERGTCVHKSQSKCYSEKSVINRVEN